MVTILFLFPEKASVSVCQKGSGCAFRLAAAGQPSDLPTARWIPLRKRFVSRTLLRYKH